MGSKRCNAVNPKFNELRKEMRALLSMLGSGASINPAAESCRGGFCAHPAQEKGPRDDGRADTFLKPFGELK